MNRKGFAALNLNVWLICCALLFFSCEDNKSEKLQLAVSANMQYAMAEIVSAFSEDSGIPCEIIVGSSGKLTAQILEGAPFDLFLSADMKYPALLHEKGFAHGPPAIYAYGTLVLWTTTEGVIPSLEAMKEDKVRHLAIASPELAPYGKAAWSVIDRLGWEDDLQGKLVFGESISQTSQFILTGAAELGFTAKSVVLSPQISGKGEWKEVEKGLYEPIAQGMIILKDGTQKEKIAGSFKNFLLSQRGKLILEKYGYQTGLEQ